MLNFYVDILKDVEFRKMYGAHFTPIYIVKRMCNEVVKLLPSHIDWDNFKFLDIASGTGVFSYYLADLLSKKYNKSFVDILNNNCIMVEIDGEFVNKCKFIFNSLLCYPTILHVDALFDEDIEKYLYDIIIGNPPYIRIQNLDNAYRHKLKIKYRSCSFGSSDIYYAFMERSLSLLKNRGVLGLITPSSYIRTESGRYVREMLSKHIYKIEDSGSEKYFDCDTYTAFTYAVKNNTAKDFVYISDINKLNIKKQDLNNNKLLVNRPISKLLLKDVCNMRGGIATLRDSIFIINPLKIDDKFIYLNSGEKLEKNATRNLIKISEIRNENDVYIEKYRCIFPYYGDLSQYRKFKDQGEFRNLFPYTFRYLESHKTELLKRDKGIYKGYRWFEFGRTQGLTRYDGQCIITSSMNKHPLFIKANLNNSLVRSGLVLFDIKYNLDNLLNKLNSDEMKKFIYLNGSKYGDGWRGYNKKVLEQYVIE